MIMHNVWPNCIVLIVERKNNPTINFLRGMLVEEEKISMDDHYGINAFNVFGSLWR